MYTQLLGYLTAPKILSLWDFTRKQIDISRGPDWSAVYDCSKETPYQGTVRKRANREKHAPSPGSKLNLNAEKQWLGTFEGGCVRKRTKRRGEVRPPALA